MLFLQLKMLTVWLSSVWSITIEPPLPRFPFSLARLHSSIIRRMQAANDRLPIGPIERIHPKRFEVIIDLNLTHRGGRPAARQWVIDNIEVAKRMAGVRDAGQGIHFQKDQPSSQYLFARLEARVALETLLGATRAIELATDAPLPLHPSPVFRGVTRLPVLLR